MALTVGAPRLRLLDARLARPIDTTDRTEQVGTITVLNCVMAGWLGLLAPAKASRLTDTALQRWCDVTISVRNLSRSALATAWHSLACNTYLG